MPGWRASPIAWTSRLATCGRCDHLRGDGAARALAEAARVIRPRGQFLLMVVNVDWWVRVAFPSIHGHGYFSTLQDVARWRDALTTAGFDVTEIGTQPGTLFLLGERKAD